MQIEIDFIIYIYIYMLYIHMHKCYYVIHLCIYIYITLRFCIYAHSLFTQHMFVIQKYNFIMYK